MLDQDIANQLRSLASIIDEPLDIAALHRRIAAHNRRTTTAKVGFAGIGVAAVVGGLLVVRDERAGPTANTLHTASAVTAPSLQAPTPTDCATALVAARASTSMMDTGPSSELQSKKRAAANAASEVDFKGVVTILTVDGQQITFHSDIPGGEPAERTGTLDATTQWTNGADALDVASTLHVGDRIALATNLGTDGIEHVVAVNLSTADTPDQTQATATDPAPDKNAGRANPSATEPTKIVDPGAQLPPGPTAKAHATVTATNGSTITLALDNVSGSANPVVIDLTDTTAAFYANDAPCSATTIAVGTEVGAAYHTDSDGRLVIDDVMLMP